jgi:hypothetical protein
MKTRKVFCAALWVFLSAAFAQAQTPEYGVIRGQVVDSDGKAVENARVYWSPIDPTLAGTGKMFAGLTHTDKEGRFTLGEVPVGEVRVRAAKYGADVPDILPYTFYALAYPLDRVPKVSVQKGKVTEDVTVKLFPPFSRLTIQVIDARTKQPINHAVVTMYYKDRPNAALRTTTDGSGKVINLIPPSLSTALTVESGGYKTWRPGDGRPGQDTIERPPGSMTELLVELQPIR